jgi:uncharacterized protein (TIGR02246 family)
MKAHLLLLLLVPPLSAQDSEIRTILKDSESAWNRGDLVAFSSYYEDSPETTFIGKEVTRGGVGAVLARYRKSYPTPEAMGTLTFSEIEIRPLTDGLALATGRYHLKRTAAGGGDATGRFTLVVRWTKAGWKIIHDHSS